MGTINYYVIAGMSVLFLIGCIAHLSENDIFSTKRVGKFRRLVYVLIFEIILDCAFELLEGSEVASIILYLVKGGELVINPILAFLVFDVFYDKKMIKQDRVMKKIRKVMLAVMIVSGVLLTLAICGLKVFYIDENNMYHRGPLIFIYVLLILASILALVSGMFIFSTKIQSTMGITMLAFAVILVVGILLRYFFPKNNYDFLCMSVSIPFLLIYYSHVTLRVDPLTKLLNRRVYSRMVERIDYTTVVIMIDANNFKQINDAYGHECGDQTLKQIAHAIYKAYGQYAYCFRTGGDEFCVILKPEVFDRLIEETPHRDVYTMTEKFMEKLDARIQHEAEADNDEGCLDYGVAQGYGIFYSQENYPDICKRMTLDEVIELADKRMYRNKELFRKNHPELDSTLEQGLTRAKVLHEPSVLALMEDDVTTDHN